MKNKLSFLSGLLAFMLVFSPLATNVYAAEGNNENDSTDDGVRDDVYFDDESDDVTGDVYNGVTEDVYGEEEEDGVRDDVYDNEDDYNNEDEYDYGNVTDDVYNGVTEDVYADNGGETTVTDKVYNAIADISGNTDKNKNIVLDYTDQLKSMNQKNLGVNFDADDIKNALKANPNATVTVNKGNVSVVIPLALLDVGQDVTFTILESDFKGAIGPVFDFTLEKADGTFITQFGDTPVTLKFVLNPADVKNWDDLVLYFIDAEGNKDLNNPIKAFKYDAKTGEIWFEVTHFSKYGVFEVASSGNGSLTGDVNAGSGDADKTATGTVDNSANDNSQVAGDRLPNTATNSFNLLAIGLLFSIAGGALLVIRKRKTAQTA